MASKANLVIDQGTTYSVSINLDDENGDPLNTGGYTSRAQMRKHYTSSNAVTFSTALADGFTNALLSDDYQSFIDTFKKDLSEIIKESFTNDNIPALEQFCNKCKSEQIEWYNDQPGDICQEIGCDGKYIRENKNQNKDYETNNIIV
jgi:hypothetical protein